MNFSFPFVQLFPSVPDSLFLPVLVIRSEVPAARLFPPRDSP